MRYPFSFRRDLRRYLPCAGGRARQPEILLQGLAGVFAVKQAAALQLGNDVADEIGIRAWHIGRRDHKTVAAATCEHLLQPVRDLLGPADDRIRSLAPAGEGNEIPPPSVASPRS